MTFSLASAQVADITHALFLAYGQHFFPFFDVLLPHLVKLLDPRRPWPDHQWGLCIFDDVIEYGGPACEKYTDHFLKVRYCLLVPRFVGLTL